MKKVSVDRKNSELKTFTQPLGQKKMQINRKFVINRSILLTVTGHIYSFANLIRSPTP